MLSDIDQVIDFLHKNVDFFSASAKDSVQFNNWAESLTENNKKFIVLLSNDIRDKILNKKIIIEGILTPKLVYFYTAICGQAIGKEDEKNSLIAGKEDRIRDFLLECPDILTMFKKHINNPVIDLWYQTQATPEQQQRHSKTLDERQKERKGRQDTTYYRRSYRRFCYRRFKEACTELQNATIGEDSPLKAAGREVLSQTREAVHKGSITIEKLPMVTKFVKGTTLVVKNPTLVNIRNHTKNTEQAIDIKQPCAKFIVEAMLGFLSAALIATSITFEVVTFGAKRLSASAAAFGRRTILTDNFTNRIGLFAKIRIFAESQRKEAIVTAAKYVQQEAETAAKHVQQEAEKVKKPCPHQPIRTRKYRRSLQ